MEVKSIIEINKQRSKVTFDSGECFVLYKGEIRLLKLREGSEVSKETYNSIYKGILPKRCKKRALNLLKTKDYTEYKLSLKLSESGYPKDIVAEALEYVKSYGYVDDLRFARDYINAKSSSYSKNEIKMKLLSKGISKRIIEEALPEDDDLQAEMEVIKKALVKKRFSEDWPYEDKQKLLAYFYRKGFEIELVRKVMNNLSFEH